MILINHYLVDQGQGRQTNWQKNIQKRVGWERTKTEEERLRENGKGSVTGKPILVEMSMGYNNNKDCPHLIYILFIVKDFFFFFEVGFQQYFPVFH
jgi:hypothetical protein